MAASDPRLAADVRRLQARLTEVERFTDLLRRPGFSNQFFTALQRGASANSVLSTVAAGGDPSTIDWVDLPSDGDVSAAANLGDMKMLRGDGGAKGIDDSGITVDDDDNLTGVHNINSMSPQSLLGVKSGLPPQGIDLIANTLVGRLDSADVAGLTAANVKTILSLSNVTDDAQLKRAADDFASFPAKATPVDNDLLLIEDSEASGVKKKILVDTLVQDADFTSTNVILATQGGALPVAVGFAQNTLLGRAGANNVEAITASQVKTLLAIDHGADVGGLDDDDHTVVYHNRNEFLNSSSGGGDAGKPIKLDAGGHVDASMINDGDIAHDSTSGRDANNHHNESHAVASHNDTTATGTELETLTDTSDADALHAHTHGNTTGQGVNDHHNESHAIESHPGTDATAVELETLTDTSDADGLHTHTHGNTTGQGTDDHHALIHTHIDNDGGGTIDHGDLDNDGTTSHTDIDSHISDTSDPHGSTMAVTVKLQTPVVENTGGDLKLMPDVQGNVVLFGDTNVDDASPSRLLEIRRRAAEGDDLLSLYIDSTRVANIFSASSMLIISQEDISLKLGDAGGDDHLRVKDSGGATVASIDSDGNLELDGTVDGVDVAARDHALIHSHSGDPEGGLLPTATIEAALPVNDNTSLVKGDGAYTKRMRIDVGAVADATVRILTMPDADVDLALVEDHASRHESGGDDTIRAATNAVNGLATAAQITKLEGIETAAKVGDVVGPASADSGEICIFDGVTGTLINTWDGAVVAGGALTLSGTAIVLVAGSQISVGTDSFLTLQNLAIHNVAGRELVRFANVGSAHNEVTIGNAANGSAPSIAATGNTDANIDLTIDGKGTGLVIVDGREVSVDGTKLDTIDENANDYTHPDHTGDVTSDEDGDQTIADEAVTLAKMAHILGPALLGRTADNVGDVEVLSNADIINFFGALFPDAKMLYDGEATAGLDIIVGWYPGLSEFQKIISWVSVDGGTATFQLYKRSSSFFTAGGGTAIMGASEVTDFDGEVYDSGWANPTIGGDQALALHVSAVSSGPAPGKLFVVAVSQRIAT